MNVERELQFIGVVKKAGEQEAEVHILPEFCSGLKNIEVFSNIIILYWFHLRNKKKG